MDISSLGGVANTYSYANQIRNKQVASPSFENSLKEATSGDSRVEAYKKSLHHRFWYAILAKLPIANYYIERIKIHECYSRYSLRFSAAFRSFRHRYRIDAER